VLLTTQYLEEADRLAKQFGSCSITVKSSPKVRPPELKAKLGTTVLELIFTSNESAQSGLDLVRDISTIPATIDGVSVELTVKQRDRPPRRTRYVASTAPASHSPDWRCVSEFGRRVSYAHGPQGGGRDGPERSGVRAR
jgi:hypothetical protein